MFGVRPVKRVLALVTLVAAVVLLGVIAYFNYDFRVGLNAVQGDTPEYRVATFLNAVVAGDEPAALTEWRVGPYGYAPSIEALVQRRIEVTKSLIARRPRSFTIENVEWWSMCCEPHIVPSSRLASGARYTINIEGIAYRIDVFADHKEEVYDGLPPRSWLVRDVYPVGGRPIYNTFPGR